MRKIYLFIFHVYWCLACMCVCVKVLCHLELELEPDVSCHVGLRIEHGTWFPLVEKSVLLPAEQSLQPLLNVFCWFAWFFLFVWLLSFVLESGFPLCSPGFLELTP